MIEDVFKNRLSIFESASDLTKYGEKHQKNSSVGQMSLFASSEVNNKPKIKEYSGGIDKLSFAMKEAELIGMCVSYDYMEDFLIYKLTYCTHSLKDIYLANDDIKNVIVIGLVTKVEHKTSKSNNKYAKVYIYDEGVEMYVYLTGDKYKKYIGYFSKNSIYMFQLDVEESTGFTSIKSAIMPENTNPNDKFNFMSIKINDFKFIKQVRDYIHKNMFGSGTNKLVFMVDNKEFPAPYLVKVSNKDLIKLKSMSCEISLERR